MKLSEFDYNLPKELIAQYPLTSRSNSRLMVLDRAKKTIQHKNFKDIASFFKKDDLLVLNDTKVLPSRLIGKRITGGKVEVFLLEREGSLFEALLRPLSKLKIGEDIIFKNDISAKVVSRNQVLFNTSSLEKIYDLGQVPLPPYIKRDPDKLDINRYQTIFAKKSGAVAAPTAGLHFDEGILKAIRSSGVDISFITLHVGLGTFKNIDSEFVPDHKMEPEYYNIPKKTFKLINEPKKGKVFACGTTVTRTLESIYLNSGRKLEGKTNIFIYPGFKFNIVDSLITNFHLPKSTLFLLVCAFAGSPATNPLAGRDFIMQAYDEAIKNKYRFYSYGDCMLIL